MCPQQQHSEVRAQHMHRVLPLWIVGSDQQANHRAQQDSDTHTHTH